MSNIIANTFVTPEGPVNGATVYAWDSSRFSGIPATDSSAPSGEPDAGPVTTGQQFGAPGNFQITVPSATTYYIQQIYNAVSYWQLCAPLDSGSAMQLPIYTDNSVGGIVITEDGAGGINLTDNGAGGIVLVETVGGITLNNDGGSEGIGLSDAGAGGISIQETGNSPLSLSTTGSIGINIKDEGSGGILVESLGTGGAVMQCASAGTGVSLIDASAGGINLTENGSLAGISLVVGGGVGAINLENLASGGINLDDSGNGGISLGSDLLIAIACSGNDGITILDTNGGISIQEQGTANFEIGILGGGTLVLESTGTASSQIAISDTDSASGTGIAITSTYHSVKLASGGAVYGAGVQIGGTGAQEQISFFGHAFAQQQSSSGVTTVAGLITLLKAYGLLS